MSLASWTEFQIVPMPITRISNAPDRPDFAAIEALLNSKHAEGWNAFQPFDFSAPALLFTRTHRRNIDEQLTEVMERLEDLEVWAPALHEEGEYGDVLDDTEEPARSRLIKAVLGVWH